MSGQKKNWLKCKMFIIALDLTSLAIFLQGFGYRQPYWAASYMLMKVSDAIIYSIT